MYVDYATRDANSYCARIFYLLLRLRRVTKTVGSKNGFTLEERRTTWLWKPKLKPVTLSLLPLRLCLRQSRIFRSG